MTTRPHQRNHDRRQANDRAGLADDRDVDQKTRQHDPGDDQPTEISQRFNDQQHQMSFASGQAQHMRETHCRADWHDEFFVGECSQELAGHRPDISREQGEQQGGARQDQPDIQPPTEGGDGHSNQNKSQNGRKSHEDTGGLDVGMESKVCW